MAPTLIKLVVTNWAWIPFAVISKLTSLRSLHIPTDRCLLKSMSFHRLLFGDEGECGGGGIAHYLTELMIDSCNDLASPTTITVACPTLSVLRMRWLDRGPDRFNPTWLSIGTFPRSLVSLHLPGRVRGPAQLDRLLCTYPCLTDLGIPYYHDPNQIIKGSYGIATDDRNIFEEEAADARWQLATIHKTTTAHPTLTSLTLLQNRWDFSSFPTTHLPALQHMYVSRGDMYNFDFIATSSERTKNNNNNNNHINTNGTHTLTISQLDEHIVYDRDGSINLFWFHFNDTELPRLHTVHLPGAGVKVIGRRVTFPRPLLPCDTKDTVFTFQSGTLAQIRTLTWTHGYLQCCHLPVFRNVTTLDIVSRFNVNLRGLARRFPTLTDLSIADCEFDHDRFSVLLGELEQLSTLANLRIFRTSSDFGVMKKSTHEKLETWTRYSSKVVTIQWYDAVPNC